MRDRYLEITYRKGKPLAAYLYFPRGSDTRSAKTERVGDGLLLDYEADGRPIGLEITAPAQITPDGINAVLRRLEMPPMDPEELAPLEAA